MKPDLINEREYASNGIKVYSCTNEHLHTFSICCYIKAGLLYEDKSEQGITHLFEHMVFRNLKSKYDIDFYDLLVSGKLWFNAATYNEFVQFSFSGLPEGFALACELITKMFDDFTLSKEEYNTELGRVKAEIRENSEKTTITYFADSKVWHGTNLEGTICGSCGGLDKISKTRLNEYKNKIISKDNFFFYLTGNAVDKDIEMLLKSLEHIKVSEKALNRSNTAFLPDDFGKRKNEVYVKNNDYYYVRISFDTDNSVIPFEIQDIIYSVLFNGDDAAVYQNLSERNHFIYSYDCVYEQYRNAGCIKLQFEVSSRKIYDAIEETVNIFNSLKNGAFSLQNAFNKHEMKQLSDFDNPDALNFVLALENHLLRNEKSAYADFASVTKEDVCSAVRKLFIPDNCVIALKGRKKDIDCNRIKKIIDRLNCHDSGEF